MIKFRCEQCGQKIGVPEKLAGRHIRCPRCKHRQLVDIDQAPPEPTPSLLETARLAADDPQTETPPEPQRILRGQTLDLEDKPAESAAEDEEAAPPGKTAQSSLLAIAGIDARTASTIGLKEPKKQGSSRGPGESAASDDVVVYKLANWPGITAGFIAVVAGCLISVGAPPVATLTVAGSAAVLATAGLVMARISNRWEQWSAIVGISFSMAALGVAGAVSFFHTVPPPKAVITAPVATIVRPVDFHAPAAVLDAIAPDRARVTVNAVRIGPPELRPGTARPDHTPRLLIYLTITNMSDRPLDYLSWGPGGRIATLSTPNGVQLAPIIFPKGALLNHPQQTTLSPHGQALDVLVFAPIYPLPHLLILDLPSGNVGGVGSMHLRIPSSVGDDKK